MCNPGRFVTVDAARNIPDFWDDITGENIFLTRKSLIGIELVNPCSQRYHYNEYCGIILVSYKLKLDLLSFRSGFSIQAPVTIIGVPVSVSQAGYAVRNPNDTSILASFIRTLPGLTIILNSDHAIPLPRGRTLSSYVLKLKWDNEQDYLNALRSGYRRLRIRARKILGPVRVVELASTTLFTPELYELYLNVFNNSTKKLEKLEISFFREYPAKIIAFYQDDRAVGFVQLVTQNKRLYFLLGGFRCHAPQASYLYAFMLNTIVCFGIQGKFEHIDFGQTAEESKLKTGAQALDKWMYVHHANPVANWCIKKTIGLFSYKPYTVMHKVFKHE